LDKTWEKVKKKTTFSLITQEERRKEKKKSTKKDRLCKKKKKKTSPEDVKDNIDNTCITPLTHVWKRSGIPVTCGAAPARKYDVA
jgi:hypothetical protein